MVFTDGLLDPFLIGALVVGLALVPLLADDLPVFGLIPHYHWLSGAAGASVAYVFVHLLPELDTQNDVLDPSILSSFEHHAYLVALFGFGLFYGLERLVGLARTHEDDVVASEADLVFWIHVGAFSGYNALIGYLLADYSFSTRSDLLVFTLVLGLHLFVLDESLREDHEEIYHRFGRWLFGGAVLVGGAVGTLTAGGDPQTAVVFSFFAGGLAMNAIKEELPSEGDGRFWSFAVGAIVYTALLVTV
jgi:hypothetical protein